MFTKTGQRVADNTSQLLSADKYLGFWLYWYQGYVSLWIDGQDQAAMTTSESDILEIHYFGMKTYLDDGDWIIHSCETPPPIPTSNCPFHSAHHVEL